MADAPTVNALKEIGKELREQNRLLGKISKTLDSLNANYVAVNRRPKDEETPDASSV